MIFRTGLGVGDVLLATSLLKALHRVHGKRYIIETRFPELFRFNPYVNTVWNDDKRSKLIQKWLGHPLIWRIGNLANHWFECITIKATYPFPCRKQHLIDAMAEFAGVELLAEERRPFIYLSPKEIEEQSWAKGWIAIQSSSTNYWTVNKHWVPGRMQEVVNVLSDSGYSIVHLGSLEDEKLENVRDLRGKSTLRQAAAILANTSLFIGLEGGLVHLSKAVGTKAVVVYTGYTTPEETGYETNVNLRDPNAGESCWQREKCEHCLESASRITSAQVVDTTLLHFANLHRSSQSS